MKTSDELDRDYKNILDMLGQINQNLSELNLGLYGDSKNGALGVIARQLELEKDVSKLWGEIEVIKKINGEQDKAIEARSTLKNDWLETIKNILMILGGLGTILAWYLILKGLLPPDTILG
jgi:hypothetical protein